MVNWPIDRKTDSTNFRMVARETIKPGVEILHEQPLSEIHPAMTDNYNPYSFFDNGPNSGLPVVERAIANLHKSAGDKFLKLRNAHPKKGPGIGIVETNIFTEEEHRFPHTYVVLMVYDRISRVDHSCQPNAEVHWNHLTHMGSLRALRKIYEGEEICIDYLGARDSLSSYRYRFNELKRQYGFECKCEVCELAHAEQTRNNNLRGDAQCNYDILFRSTTGVAALPEHAIKYINCLQSLRIRDGRLASGFNRLFELEEEQAKLAIKTVLANGHHCQRCLGNGRTAALFHFKKARAACMEAYELDRLTHGPDHPIIGYDRAAFDRITDQVISHMP